MIALDSNVLVYMTGIAKVAEDRRKIATIFRILERLSGKARLLAPLQALGETYVVLQRMGLSRDQSRSIVQGLKSNLRTVGTTSEAFDDAFDLAAGHKLQFWDALILNVAAEAGCTLLLSEDMQPGFTWRGVTVVNPVAEPLDRSLLRAMGD